MYVYISVRVYMCECVCVPDIFDYITFCINNTSIYLYTSVCLCVRESVCECVGRIWLRYLSS